MPTSSVSISCNSAIHNPGWSVKRALAEGLEEYGSFVVCCSAPVCVIRTILMAQLNRPCLLQILQKTLNEMLVFAVLVATHLY